ncbi:DUF433 domain-containing protein [Moorena sp. SIO3I6]|uniref:DUF433 domain-containing protein n=1 Tax=Moorena sp. SIO3I6 TaxID=2607831 RepID=UPI0025EBE208|nr:DUF433 domain-containing protein [Moorena sp. SIO3I6]
MNWRDYIHSNPNILLGKPVVKGTRLSVEFILGLFAAGWTELQILESYPTLTPESIRAIFAFTREQGIGNREQGTGGFHGAYKMHARDRNSPSL